MSSIEIIFPDLEIACRQVAPFLRPYQPIWLQIYTPYDAPAAEAWLKVRTHLQQHPIGLIIDTTQPERNYSLVTELNPDFSSYQQVYPPYSLDSSTGLRLAPLLITTLAEHLATESYFYLITSNFDHFQSIYSFYGKDAADFFFQTQVRCLQEKLPTAEAFFLMSGRCAFLLPASTYSIDELEAKLNTLAHHSITWQDYLIHTTVTFGVTLHHPKQSSCYRATPDSLLCSSGLALNKAKDQKSSVFIDTNNPHLKLEYGQYLRSSHLLIEAFKHDNLSVFYQPIYCNQTNQLISQECLARIHQEHGWVGADQFVNQASFLRLQGDLSLKVLELACLAFESSPRPFSLNLMPEDLLNDHTLGAIIEHLEQSKLGSWLTIELVETSQLLQLPRARTALKRLDQLGCKLAIDDFGSGYANFTYLTDLQPQWLKLDGSLIRDLPSNADLRRLVAGIVDIATNLGIQTIAEYVHSQEVHTCVQHLGITASQGFYLGKPRPEPW